MIPQQYLEEIKAKSSRRKRELKVVALVVNKLKELLRDRGMDKESISLEIREVTMQYELHERMTKDATKTK